jgi:hypothetical protein
VSIRFEAVTLEGLPELCQFLNRTMPAASTSKFSADSPLLHWKYIDPHPLWSGSRSWVLRKVDESGAAEIGAHGCASPVRHSTGERELRSLQVIDWAGGTLIPGGGLAVYREFLTRNDVLLAIGGSADTRKIVPMVRWFREAPALIGYARPLRPFAQIVASPSKNWKTPARLARNLQWSLSPTLPSGGNWQAIPVSRFEGVWTPGVRTIAPLVRTADWLNYLLACPNVKMQAFELREGSTARGHALLSFAGPQVRIADLVVDSDRDYEWSAALAQVIRTATGDAHEIVAASNLPLMRNAIEACGLRPRRTDPIFVADPKKQLGELTPEVNLSIGDGFYLTDPAVPFWT